MDEEWRPVKGHEGLYEVSNLGRVRSIRSGKVLNGRRIRTGYLRVHLTYNRDAYIHRIVAEAFCDHPKGCDVVNHIDNDPTNNCAYNLEWTTQRGNVLHAMGQGRVEGFPNASGVIGTKDGIEHFFNSSHEAAQFVGCYHKTILHACKTGHITRSGYFWRKAG